MNKSSTRGSETDLEAQFEAEAQSVCDRAVIAREQAARIRRRISSHSLAAVQPPNPEPRAAVRPPTK